MISAIITNVMDMKFMWEKIILIVVYGLGFILDKIEFIKSNVLQRRESNGRN